MGWGKTIAYIGLRAIAAACTGGASEAAFVTADLAGAAFAAVDVANAVSDLASSGKDFADTVQSALADGDITPDEAHALLASTANVGLCATAVAETAAELKDELRAMGARKVSGSDVMTVARKVSHCSVCKAPGVNKRSHVKGHKLAHKHRF